MGIISKSGELTQVGDLVQCIYTNMFGLVDQESTHSSDFLVHWIDSNYWTWENAKILKLVHRNGKEWLTWI